MGRFGALFPKPTNLTAKRKGNLRSSRRTDRRQHGEAREASSALTRGSMTPNALWCYGPKGSVRFGKGVSEMPKQEEL